MSNDKYQNDNNIYGGNGYWNGQNPNQGQPGGPAYDPYGRGGAYESEYLDTNRNWDDYVGEYRETPPRQTQKPRNGGKKSRKRKKRRSILRGFLTLFILLLVSAGVFGFLYFRDIMDQINFVTPGSEPTRDSRIRDVNGIVNILLIGEDAREGQNGQRSDSMILCTVNPMTQEVILTSFMRDMYISIPDHGKNRINASFSLGGVELLERTIMENFGVHIDGFVAIDFAGFLQSIAAVGDMAFELTEEEARYMNEHPEYGSEIDWVPPDQEPWDLQPGWNTLTPEQLLAYSRMRHVGNSDWDRTERQRKVIMAAYQQIKDASVPKLLSIMDASARFITTDISKTDLLSYAYLAAGDGIQKIESNRIPADGTFEIKNINGMDVLVPDIDANITILQEFINNERSNDTGFGEEGEEGEEGMEGGEYEGEAYEDEGYANYEDEGYANYEDEGYVEGEAAYME